MEMKKELRFIERRYEAENYRKDLGLCELILLDDVEEGLELADALIFNEFLKADEVALTLNKYHKFEDYAEFNRNFFNSEGFEGCTEAPRGEELVEEGTLSFFLEEVRDRRNLVVEKLRKASIEALDHYLKEAEQFKKLIRLVESYNNNRFVGFEIPTEWQGKITLIFSVPNTRGLRLKITIYGNNVYEAVTEAEDLQGNVVVVKARMFNRSNQPINYDLFMDNIEKYLNNQI